LAGLTREDFERSPLHQDAVMRALEVVGEAARKVSDETRKMHPEVPWVDMVGMRHRLAHDYLRVDLQRVWDTVREDAPKLIALIEPLVPPPTSE
jgi:uncharacterized protein with HEPN domain